MSLRAVSLAALVVLLGTCGAINSEARGQRNSDFSLTDVRVQLSNKLPAVSVSRVRSGEWF